PPAPRAASRTPLGRRRARPTSPRRRRGGRAPERRSGPRGPANEPGPSGGRPGRSRRTPSGPRRPWWARTRRRASGPRSPEQRVHDREVVAPPRGRRIRRRAARALRRQAHAGEELLLGVDDVREHVAGAPALARARGVPVGDRLDLGGEGRGAPPPGGERVG